MTPTRGRARRVRVLLAASRLSGSWDPWGVAMLHALSRAHDVIEVDPGRPLAEQVADPSIEAVVDPAYQATPEVAAAAAGHVRLWQLGSVGYDKVDLPSLVRHGIPTANQPGLTSSRSLAEQALMLTMMVARDYQGLAAAVEAGTLAAPFGRQLAGRSLLIVGLGASGRQLARRARAFDMTVTAVTRRGRDIALERRYDLAWMGGIEGLDGALAEADVVSLHLPLSPETRHILDARRLGLLPRGAIVVNVSRGGLIDEVALAAAVVEGRLLGAGLDVVDGEPVQGDHPLCGVPGVIISPHVAGATDASVRRRARFAALNVSRVGYGLDPLCRIDHVPR